MGCTDLGRWTDIQAKDWQDSLQTHLWRGHTVTGDGAHKCMKAFRLLLIFELIMVMPSIIQSLPLFPTLYGPDLSVFPRWSPADSEGQKGSICFVSARYAFNATTWDTVSPRIYVSWLKPAPHRETVSISCLHYNIWVYPSLCVFTKTLWIFVRY